MTSASQAARKYLQEKDIAGLFETLMTGLIYTRPDDHIDFLLRCLNTIKKNNGQKLNWDAFIENPPPEDVPTDEERVLSAIGAIAAQPPSSVGRPPTGNRPLFFGLKVWDPYDYHMASHRI
uniref:Uncharacterized protein n=1 Tax=Romanomermis culicivorax TaxID=13658 RepID=A0A915KC21_ROMCU